MDYFLMVLLALLIIVAVVMYILCLPEFLVVLIIVGTIAITQTIIEGIGSIVHGRN